MKFEDAISEVKRRVDIVRVIGQHVALKKSGSNWTGLCPFHEEKGPSFSVRPDKGFFKCFGCGAAGDIFTFLEKKTGQLFADVVRQLAKENNIFIDTPVKSEKELKELTYREKLFKVLLAAHEWFRNNLKQNPGENEAVSYLTTERKLTQNQIDLWGIGFGGVEDRFKMASKEAFELGLVREGQRGLYGSFTRRVVFPIRDHHGQVVGFGGRAYGPLVEGKPKYINSPSSEVYDKSKILFGLYESLSLIQKKKPVVIAEGYFDVVSIVDVGMPAVAPCGTSLTESHLLLLARFTKQVILCLDQDKAGQKAHLKALMMLLRAGFQVRTAILPDKDPDLLWRSGKKAVLQQSLDQAEDAVSVLLRQTSEMCTLGIAERIQSIQAVLPYLSASPSPLVNRQYVRLAAKILQEDENTLLREVTRRNPKNFSYRPSVPPEEREVVTPKNQVEWTEGERTLFRALVTYPEWVLKLPPSNVFDWNPEFKAFIDQIRSIVQESPHFNSAEVLAKVSVPKDSLMLPMLLDLSRHRNWITREQAGLVVEGFLEGLEQKKVRARLSEVKRKFLEALKRGDKDLVKSLMVEQSAILRQIHSPQPQEKKQAKPKAEMSVEEECPDEGWT